MRRPAFLLAGALLLGLIGFARAEAEFGTRGVIAFAKLILAPAAGVLLLFILGSGRYTGELPRLRTVLITVAVLTGIASALSALLGVGWLVAK